MAEPKFKVGDEVEVNASHQTRLFPRWVRTTVISVATHSMRGIPFTYPVYTTGKGSYTENGVRAVKKEAA